MIIKIRTFAKILFYVITFSAVQGSDDDNDGIAKDRCGCLLCIVCGSTCQGVTNQLSSLCTLRFVVDCCKVNACECEPSLCASAVGCFNRMKEQLCKCQLHFSEVKCEEGTPPDCLCTKKCNCTQLMDAMNECINTALQDCLEEHLQQDVMTFRCLCNDSHRECNMICPEDDKSTKTTATESGSASHTQKPKGVGPQSSHVNDHAQHASVTASQLPVGWHNRLNEAICNCIQLMHAMNKFKMSGPGNCTEETCTITATGILPCGRCFAKCSIVKYMKSCTMKGITTVQVTIICCAEECTPPAPPTKSSASTTDDPIPSTSTPTTTSSTSSKNQSKSNTSKSDKPNTSSVTQNPTIPSIQLRTPTTTTSSSSSFSSTDRSNAATSSTNTAALAGQKNAGFIVGVVFAFVMIMVLALLIIVFIYRRRRTNERTVTITRSMMTADRNDYQDMSTEIRRPPMGNHDNAMPSMEHGREINCIGNGSTSINEGTGVSVYDVIGCDEYSEGATAMNVYSLAKAPPSESQETILIDNQLYGEKGNYDNAMIVSPVEHGRGMKSQTEPGVNFSNSGNLETSKHTSNINVDTGVSVYDVIRFDENSEVAPSSESIAVSVTSTTTPSESQETILIDNQLYGDSALIAAPSCNQDMGETSVIDNELYG